VQDCPLWTANVPVYASPDSGGSAQIVGRLVYQAPNWFIGPSRRSRFTLGEDTNVWWAYTMADNGKLGWVPEVYFTGGGNDVPDAGLYSCGTHGNSCP
jgi:hypothetical protein